MINHPKINITLVHNVIGKYAYYEGGIICGFYIVSLNSSPSTTNLTEICVLKSFLMWKVLVITDFLYTFPKSISTGPAKIFYNSSPPNFLLTSLY